MNITVGELIENLKKQDQDMEVATICTCECCTETVPLGFDDLRIKSVESNDRFKGKQVLSIHGTVVY